MSAFKWSEKSTAAAIALADGKTQEVAAQEAGVTARTIRRWLRVSEFAEEVDRLSLMVGIASRAERLRIAKRVARQFIHDQGPVLTDKDLLDWLKFAQGETDGLKLDLAAIAEAAAFVAGTRQD